MFFWAPLPSLPRVFSSGTQPARPRVPGKTNGVYTCTAGLNEPLDGTKAGHEKLGNCWLVKHRIRDPVVRWNSPCIIPVLFQSKHILNNQSIFGWQRVALQEIDKIIWTTPEETQGKLHT